MEWYDSIRMPAFRTGDVGDEMSEAFRPGNARRYDQRAFSPYGAGGSGGGPAQEAEGSASQAAMLEQPRDDRADFYGMGKRGAPSDRADFYGLSSGRGF